MPGIEYLGLCIAWCVNSQELEEVQEALLSDVMWEQEAQVRAPGKGRETGEISPARALPLSGRQTLDPKDQR